MMQIRPVYVLFLLTMPVAFRFLSQDISQIVLCLANHIYMLACMFDPNEYIGNLVFIQGTIYYKRLFIAASLVQRSHFLFEGYKARHFLYVLFVADLITLAGFMCFMIPEGDMMLTPQAVRRLTYKMLIMLVCQGVTELYFDMVRQGAFNELRGYSERVQRATQEKQVFLACMSHEIRNPLQSLVGSVELLQSCEGREQQQVYTGIIKNGCEIVLNLVSNMLDASKIEAQKMELAPVPSSLSENVGKIARLLADRAKGKGIDIQYVESTSVPPCSLFDPHKLQQVILNLVSNAIKFTHRGHVVINVSWTQIEETDDAAKIVEEQLRVSNWKWMLSPAQEVEDEKGELDHRLRVRDFLPCSPSHRLHKLLHAEEDPRKLGDGNLNVGLLQEPESQKNTTNTGLDLRKVIEISREPVCSATRNVPGDKSSLSGRCGAGTGDDDSALPRGVATHDMGTTVRRGVAKIEVMDTGIGISKEGIERLFKPYQQANASISQYHILV